MTISVLNEIHTNEWSEQYPGIISALAISRPNCSEKREKSNLLLCIPLKRLQLYFLVSAYKVL